jgi:uncharacterized protein (UPF0332 family)
MMEPAKHELVLYRINRAKKTLEEATLLIDNKMFNTSVNRIYYSCFYAVTALLAARHTSNVWIAFYKTRNYQ